MSPPVNCILDGVSVAFLYESVRRLYCANKHHHLILYQTLPSRIHRLGSVRLHHLGEVSAKCIEERRGQETMRLRSASVTASVRLATPNFDRILLT